MENDSSSSGSSSTSDSSGMDWTQQFPPMVNMFNIGMGAAGQAANQATSMAGQMTNPAGSMANQVTSMTGKMANQGSSTTSSTINQAMDTVTRRKRSIEEPSPELSDPKEGDEIETRQSYSQYGLNRGQQRIMARCQALIRGYGGMGQGMGGNMMGGQGMGMSGQGMQGMMGGMGGQGMMGGRPGMSGGLGSAAASMAQGLGSQMIGQGRK